jgi:hypothetical protein
MNRLQDLLSISTCAATHRHQLLANPGAVFGPAEIPQVSDEPAVLVFVLQPQPGAGAPRVLPRVLEFQQEVDGRELHSSTFQLNLSRFCH